MVFFPKNELRIAVVYGRNGSGKSTISRAFTAFEKTQNNKPDEDELSADSLEYSPHSDLYSELLPSPPISDITHSQNTHHVLVFNEAYIDHKIKVESDGLGAVVLFDEQSNIRDEIRTKRQEISTLETKLANATLAQEEAEESERKASRNLERQLKKGWGDRSRRINSNANATPSWSKTRDHLFQVPPASGDLSEVLIELERKISEYQQISEAEHIQDNFEGKAPEDLVGNVRLDLLSTSLQLPGGGGLQATIAKNLEQFESNIHDAVRVFSDQTVTHCPMCQQTVNEKYRNELLNAIRQAIDEEADKLCDELDNSKLPLFVLPKSSLDERLGIDSVNKLQSAVEEFNNRVAEWNSVCEAKKSQLYSSVSWDTHELNAAARVLIERINEVEGKRVAWNSAVDDRVRLLENLIAQNDRVTRLESLSLFEQCGSARVNREKADYGKRESIETLSRARGELSDLIARYANVQVAADEINTQMQDIFAERDRLKLERHVDSLEPSNSLYRVLSRGHSLRPDELSVSERNILALTYFFTEVRKEIDELSSFESFLIVIDDPISSVDVDNRLGIHGFLESQMRTLLKITDRLRFVFLTHDLTAARDIYKSSQSATERKKKTVTSYLLRPRTTEDDPGPLKVAALDKLNEYETLLNAVYQFAASDESETGKLETITIGNSMRRVLEAFSTFIYGVGILDPVLEDAYSEATGGQSLSIDLRAGHRGFLHDTSHAADGISSLRNFGGIFGLDKRECILHVRRILALMYTLQKAHMVRYLPDGAEENVLSWKEEMTSF